MWCVWTVFTSQSGCNRIWYQQTRFDSIHRSRFIQVWVLKLGLAALASASKNVHNATQIALLNSARL